MILHIPKFTVSVILCNIVGVTNLNNYYCLVFCASPTWCHAQKRVGACLVMHEPRRAISVGYNGYPDGCAEIDEGKGLYNENQSDKHGVHYKIQQNAVPSPMQ